MERSRQRPMHTTMGFAAEYRRLLKRFDRRAAVIERTHPGVVHCGKGCGRCCVGVFDIGVLDGILLAAALEALTDADRRAIVRRSRAALKRLKALCPDFAGVFEVTRDADRLVDRACGEFDYLRCPALAADDSCLLYDARPMVCRMQGMPIVDTCDTAVIGRWCGTNSGARGRVAAVDLAMDFSRVLNDEARLNARLERGLGFPRPSESAMFTAFALSGGFSLTRKKKRDIQRTYKSQGGSKWKGRSS
jgi:Fe-S-cluster containining protein